MQRCSLIAGFGSASGRIPGTLWWGTAFGACGKFSGISIRFLLSVESLREEVKANTARGPLMSHELCAQQQITAARRGCWSPRLRRRAIPQREFANWSMAMNEVERTAWMASWQKFSWLLQCLGKHRQVQQHPKPPGKSRALVKRQSAACVRQQRKEQAY